MKKKDFTIEVVEEGVDPGEREKVIKKIREDYDDLKKKFKAGGDVDFEQMAKTIGDHAVLVTPEGDRITGQVGLKHFWAGVNKNVDLDFKLLYLSIHAVAEPGRNLHFAHEVTEFSLITRTGGTLKNTTGTWDRTLLHPQSCVWEP